MPDLIPPVFRASSEMNAAKTQQTRIQKTRDGFHESVQHFGISITINLWQLINKSEGYVDIFPK